MKNILFILFTLFALSADAQVGLFKPKYIGWPTDSTANLILGWNPSTYKCEWLESFGGGDSLVITADSICVIYLGDTICVSAASDSFYLSGDTSLCVIHLGDTLCSPYSAAGTTLYTGNGAFPAFAARVVNLNQGQLKFERRSGYYNGNGYIRFPQSGLYPLMHIAQGVVGNSTSSSLEFTPAFSAEDDLFVDFNGNTAAEDYSFGVARSASLNPFTIEEGIDLGGGTGRPMMQFYGTGDSIVVVNDLLAGGSSFRIRANTTAATGSTQKGLDVSLLGANATAAQYTYAGYFSNTHTGTAPFNYGVYATTNAALGASISGNNSAGGTGVEGICSTGAGNGVYGQSSAGFGVSALSSSSTGALKASAVPSSTTGTATVASFVRETTGTAADGIEAQFPISIETSTGAIQSANIWSYQWSTANNATRHSKVILYGVSNGTTNELFSIEGDKRFVHNGRNEEKQGADVASVAGAIALGYDGNTFEITGTNAITLISNLGWQNGSTVTLLFTSTASLTDGTANSGTDIGMELAGNANFGATADDAITLKLCEIGGTQRWREISRTAN